MKTKITQIALSVLCSALFVSGANAADKVSADEAKAPVEKQGTNTTSAAEAPLEKKPADGGATLAEKATNPLASMIQMRIQNFFIFDSMMASGQANRFDIQPVIPIKSFGGLPRVIFRPTIPIITTPDIDGGPDGTTGLGDLDYVAAFAFDKPWGSLGIGPAGAMPTSTDLRVGARKWTLGPALLGLYKKIPHTQLGALVFNTWDVGGSGPGHVNELNIELIALKHWGKGWYAGWGDESFIFDWEHDTNYLPISGRVGKLVSLGKQNMLLEGQLIYNVGDEVAGQEQWGFKLTLSFLFPE